MDNLEQKIKNILNEDTETPKENNEKENLFEEVKKKLNEK